MAIDKLNSLQFLFLRPCSFEEFGELDGVRVDRVPFELRSRLYRWKWAKDRDDCFFEHEGYPVIKREGWEEFVRWVCESIDRAL
jgi:hypothetical protein